MTKVKDSARTLRAPLSIYRETLREGVEAFDRRVANRPKLVRPRQRFDAPRVVSDASLALKQDIRAGVYQQNPPHLSTIASKEREAF